MPPEKTDPNGIAGLLAKPPAWAITLLILVGPGAGYKAAAYTDDRDEKIAALELRVERLSSDVSRLADTLGDVRKIEEAAHPRVGVPRDSTP